MNRTLLTVSGVIPDGISIQISRKEKPLTDYLAMALKLPADLVDYPGSRTRVGRWGRLLERILSKNVLMAFTCFLIRQQYAAILTDGEQIGIPYAMLVKFFGRGYRPKHLMIAHILSVPKKKVLLDCFNLQQYIDRFIVYSTWQKHFIEDRWRIEPGRVVFTPFTVDANFYSPAQVADPLDFHGQNRYGYPVICSAGLERRDYPTLLQAVENLGVFVVIAAGSPWSKQADPTRGEQVPENVIVQSYSQSELRRLYATSRFVVMPLQDVPFQAGVTAILEAMSMEKAVICSRSAGQTDIVEEGITGMYVPPRDPRALREAICYLIERPAEAARMGKIARERVVATMALGNYVDRIKQLVSA